MSYTVKQLLEMASHELKDRAERPLQEAKILLGFFMNQDHVWLMSHEDHEVHEPQRFFSLMFRRQSGEPIEYITGKVSFYSQEFIAAPGALIARPETELLIDQVLALVPKDFSGHIVEVGVGSGIISIVLAQHLPKARISAVDISLAALAVANDNVKKFGLGDRIKLFEGDLLSPISEDIDLLVSNPPYVEEGVLLEKPLHFEPQNALFGGKSGDEVLKRLIDEAGERKIPLVACEMGYDQKKPLSEYIAEQNIYDVTFYKDLAQFDRGFVMKLKGEKNA
jgi:release factor glutamine methyltransferase